MDQASPAVPQVEQATYVQMDKWTMVIAFTDARLGLRRRVIEGQAAIRPTRMYGSIVWSR